MRDNNECVLWSSAKAIIQKSEKNLQPLAEKSKLGTEGNPKKTSFNVSRDAEY